MEILFIIVIFALVTIISAASSAAKKKSSSNEDQRPQRTSMSDIQRAFMMMTGMDNEREEPPQPYSQPYVAPPPVIRAPDATFDEGKSDFGLQASGSIRGEEIERPSSGSMRYDIPADSDEGYSSVSTLQNEGTHFETLIARSEIEASGTSPLLVHRLDDSADAADLRKERIFAEANSKPALKLFQDRSDFVKAVIYSEILRRRPVGKRSANS